MRRRYNKPQIEVILPYQELLDVGVKESGGGPGPGGSDNNNPGRPSLDAKQWKFSVWDDEEESDDVWN